MKEGRSGRGEVNSVEAEVVLLKKGERSERRWRT